MKKRIFSTFSTCIVVVGISTCALAAMTSFSTMLPAHQEDAEVSTVRKSDDTDYFTVKISTMGDESDKVCIWTEGDTTGMNYSSPYKQIGTGSHDLKYTKHKPDIGENVVLNIDNPVDSDYQMFVCGKWSPN